MPHDRDGKLLGVGDSVLVPARITAIHDTEEYCNVTLETSQPMYPSNDRSQLNLNAKQVVLFLTRAGKYPVDGAFTGQKARQDYEQAERGESQ